MKKFGFVISLLFILICTQSAFSIPGGWTDHTTIPDVTFNLVQGTATVACDVYEYSTPTSSQYIYTYQITNDSSPIGLNFYSIDVADDVNVWSPSIDSDPINNTVDPVFWTLSGPLPEVDSVNYLFGDTVDIGETSSLLWYVSDTPAGTTSATLYDQSQGAQEPVLAPVPVPEPMTVTLLGLGGLAVFKRKRKLTH